MKRFLVAAAAALLALAMLAGCRGDGDGGTPGEIAGEAFHADWTYDTSPITFDVYFNASWFTDEWTTDEPTRSSSYITRKTGVDINFIAPTGNEAERFQTMIASRDVPDIMLFSPYDVGARQAMDAGLFLNLVELAERYDPTFFDVVTASQIGWLEHRPGVLYSWPNFSHSYEAAMAMDYEARSALSGHPMVGVRHDIYEAIGRPDMSYPEGFLNALIAVREQFPTVDGMPFYLMQMEFGDFGSQFIDQYIPELMGLPQTTDDGFFDPLTYEPYLEWLRTLRLANEMGLIARDTFIDGRPQWQEKMAGARYFMITMGRADQHGNNSTLWSDMGGQETGVWYEVAYAFNHPDGRDPRIGGSLLLDGWMNLHITVNNRDPARAIRFLNFIMGPEGQHNVFFGEHGVTWDYVDEIPTIHEHVLNAPWEDFSRRYFVNGSNWAFWNSDIQVSFPEAPREWHPSDGWRDFGNRYMVLLPEWQGMTIDTALHPDIAIIDTNIGMEWGSVLPRMLMADSDEEFDSILESFLQRREQLGFAQLQEVRWNMLQDNKVRLGRN